MPARHVGWYWIISMSISGAPTRYAIAIPSAVQINAFVVGLQIWPLPPVARITFFASNSSIEPSRMFLRDGPNALALVIHGERGGEVLLVAVDLLGVLHQLLVEDVHDRLAGDVGDVVGARR